MADKVTFELVSPERLLVSEPVDMVVVPGAEGDFGVLIGHTPMISSIRMGTIDIYQDGARTQRFFVSGGFAEVTTERCTILAEGAVPVDEIDRTQVEEDLRAAEKQAVEAVDDAERTQAEAGKRLAEAKLSIVSQ
ncbi:MAG: F0F1 ATP synthase subunit epsilon [Alphaproteobacteria bacterium]